MKAMDVFQIWMSGEPSLQLQKWMGSIVASLPDGSTYTLIAPRNFLENKNVRFFNVADAVSALVSVAPYTNEVWSSLVPQTQSDLIRFWWASSHGNALYLDCDCQVNKWPEFDKSGLYFSTRVPKSPVLDIFSFYVNSELDAIGTIFESIIKEAEREAVAVGEVSYGAAYVVVNAYNKSHLLNKIDSYEIAHYPD